MVRPTVFLSHATVDRRVALALKAAVESTFEGTLEVFVSSDPTDDPIGEAWLSLIRKKIAGSIVIVVLTSPISLVRPWVNFEIGAAWMKGIPVVSLQIVSGGPQQSHWPIDRFDRLDPAQLSRLLVTLTATDLPADLLADVPSRERLAAAIRDALEQAG